MVGRRGYARGRGHGFRRGRRRRASRTRGSRPGSRPTRGSLAAGPGCRRPGGTTPGRPRTSRRAACRVRTARRVRGVRAGSGAGGRRPARARRSGWSRWISIDCMAAPTSGSSQPTTWLGDLLAYDGQVGGQQRGGDQPRLDVPGLGRVARDGRERRPRGRSTRYGSVPRRRLYAQRGRQAGRAAGQPLLDDRAVAVRQGPVVDGRVASGWRRKWRSARRRAPGSVGRRAARSPSPTSCAG